MKTYVALPRAINAGVSMKMEDLRKVFEDLDFQNIRTILASGNVIFETEPEDEKSLEEKIEKALMTRFGVNISTVVRSIEDIKTLIKREPFKNVIETPETRLFVTFLKNVQVSQWKFPYIQREKGYSILGISDRVVYSVMDLTGAKTPDLMSVLDKAFGKTVTTRSWNTVLKIAKLSI